MTQPELADLIARGFEHPQVSETTTQFIARYGQPAQAMYECCLLGAAIIGRFGTEEALRKWIAFEGDCCIAFSAQELDIHETVLAQVERDHACLGVLPVLTKLRESQYQE